MTLNIVKRPIAVIMIFLALTVLGSIAAMMLPVSLMPDVDIPEVSVRINHPAYSARQMENGVVKVLRNQLMQVSHLADINSEASDGTAIITLRFEHGTDINMAFVESNEKIDRAMQYLSKDISRPQVIKASASDIPVLYLNLKLEGGDGDNFVPTELFPVPDKFVDLSRFARNVISRRLEQISEVAMVDVTGTIAPEVLLIPNREKMLSMGITTEELENMISRAQIKVGNLLIRDGHYQYNLTYVGTLIEKEDIGNLWLNKRGKLIQVKEIADIIIHPAKQSGMVLSEGDMSISLAVIKQSDAQMNKLKESLSDLVKILEEEYSQIEFEVTRDQTELLTYSIRNLRQSLLIGGILAILIMFFFMNDIKSPLLVTVTVPLSLIISLLLFYATGISLNIISLSGLILGVGMMIDNSIIVIDNITQRYRRGDSITVAAASGAREVFAPMLSSVLTTCAVFVPLIFLSGITGALFYDQAIAITIGLFSSLIVSVTILPVTYRLLYKRDDNSKKREVTKDRSIVILMERGYEWLMIKSLRNQGKMLAIAFAAIALSALIYSSLSKRSLPHIERNDIIVSVDWNEHIHVGENRDRTLSISKELKPYLEQEVTYVGEQQFVMDKSGRGTVTGARIYLKCKSNEDVTKMVALAKKQVEESYPLAKFETEEVGNFFELLFKQHNYLIEAHISPRGIPEEVYLQRLEQCWKALKAGIPEERGGVITPIALKDQIVLKVDPIKVALYGVSESQIVSRLQMAMSDYEVLTLNSGNIVLPVKIGGEERKLEGLLEQTLVRSSNGNNIQLSLLTEMGHGENLKQIVAGVGGEYYPIGFNPTDNEQGFMAEIKGIVNSFDGLECSFNGSMFEREAMIRELLMVLIVSMLLLYFIMATQFESLILPLIVLIELPIDLFGAFLMLKLGGSSVNVMALIGIVVMSGIIINDSILKIDTINRLVRDQGYSLLRALMMGGLRRLKPIVMTSLTTILAMVPFLFGSGMGNDLQRPLALAVIGGMVIGTLVSLFVVPVIYYQFEKAKLSTKREQLT